MRKPSPYLFLFFAIMVLTATAQDECKIAWNFDNGSLGGWSRNDAGEIVLTHAPGAGEIWFYFQVDGLEGKTQTFVFENARKDFYGVDALPVISYDQVNWAYIKKRTVFPDPSDLDRVRFTFTHTFAANRAWLAFTPPYTNPDLDRLTTSIHEHPHVSVIPLCDSPLQKLPIPVVTITDPEIKDSEKKCVFFLAREEAMESASSWLCQGIIRFLLSDDPVAAAIKRRCIVILIPLFDRDGVALGTAVHPLANTGMYVYWTESWPETSYSFYEQRQLKRFLQWKKDEGQSIDYCFRLHSGAWQEDHFRREQCAEPNFAAQDNLFGVLLTGKYLPWYRNQERVLQDTRFSKFVFDLFPNVQTGLCQSQFIYTQSLVLPFTLYKTPDDLSQEGELIANALAEMLGVPASDPPPFLLGAELYEIAGPAGKTFPVRCVYRDLLNRPPHFVRVVVDDTPFELKPYPVGSGDLNYQTGVLYTGYVQSKNAVGSHYFTASNGSRTCTLPHQDRRLGPLVNAPAALQKR